MPQAPLEKTGRSSDRLTRSIFFLSAVLFHLIVFAALADYILFPTIPTPPDPGMVYVPSVPTAVPTPPPTPISPPVINPPASTYTAITGSKGAPLIVPVQPLNIAETKGPGDTHKWQEPPKETIMDIPDRDPRLTDLKDTVLNKWHMSQEQIANKDPSCTFPVYIASYAHGDWDCNTRLDQDGNIVAGSIPNLVAKINEWSHGQIKGEIVPKPLDVASPELLDKMPPFIFFTGHKDFVLTDGEVDNLRSYLNRGGLIWGDNALAGQGSRFDVAFHREMKRVIPDLNKNFETYSLADDIFAKGRYPITEIPAGMNYYTEMPQHLDIGGTIAILYTPDDYSDMMFMRILPGDKSFFVTYKPVPAGTLYTNNAFVDKGVVFYRNFDLKSSLAVHRLGMNIISYLLVRFDDQLLMAH